MEDIARRAYLYDFYGELLTKHQQKIYEDAVMNDLSLSEIAEETGTSRQAVHDIIKRVDGALEEYESKLGLYKKFKAISAGLEKISELTEKEEIRKIVLGLMQEL